jgi:hypothetical protein
LIPKYGKTPAAGVAGAVAPIVTFREAVAEVPPDFPAATLKAITVSVWAPVSVPILTVVLHFPPEGVTSELSFVLPL